MHEKDPWAVISPAGQPGTLSTRRVDATHPQDLFWARDEAGTRSLVLRWEMPKTIIAAANRMHGIVLEHAPNMVKVVLKDMEFLDVFRALCEDLVEQTRPCGDVASATRALESRLAQWQRLLAKGRRGLLDEKQIRGLIGELQFLCRELVPRYGADAMGLWTGPEGTSQDFQVGTTIFEIKSRSASTAPSVEISSAEQLWCLGPNRLLLVVYAIGRLPVDAGGRTLKSVVDEARRLATPGASLDGLEEKLITMGYMDRPEYSEDGYEVSDPIAFDVISGFPRLTPPDIPEGIDNVHYRLHLDRCMPFTIGIDEILSHEA